MKSYKISAYSRLTPEERLVRITTEQLIAENRYMLCNKQYNSQCVSFLEQQQYLNTSGEINISDHRLYGVTFDDDFVNVYILRNERRIKIKVVKGSFVVTLVAIRLSNPMK